MEYREDMLETAKKLVTELTEPDADIESVSRLIEELDAALIAAEEAAEDEV